MTVLSGAQDPHNDRIKAKKGGIESKLFHEKNSPPTTKMMDLIKFNNKLVSKCESSSDEINHNIENYRNFNLDKRSIREMGEDSEANDLINDDNESVLSVGREDNYDSDKEENPGQNVEMEDVEERIPNKIVTKEQESSLSPPGREPVSKLKLEEIKLSFKNIHNHLSSIKNYPNFSLDPGNLWKGPANYLLSHEQEMNMTHLPHTLNSDLVQRYESFYANGRLGLPPGPMINGHDLNEANLKFSIDNILKADFGRRRITDPINKLRASVKNCANQNASSINKQKLPPNHLLALSNHGFLNSNPLSPTSSLSTSSSPPILASPPPSLSSVQSPASSGMFSPMDLTQSPTPTLPKPPNRPSSSDCATKSNSTATTPATSEAGGPMVWPAWVYCTRYSDRPSSGPRTRKPKKPSGEKGSSSASAAVSAAVIPSNSSDSSGNGGAADDKRPRTAFSGPQLARLKHEFNENRYLTERRRQQLSGELGLNEAQIKIWFQNKRAKIKKASGQKNPLALQLMAQGLYNHSTVPLTKEEEKLQELHAQNSS